MVDVWGIKVQIYDSSRKGFSEKSYTYKSPVNYAVGQAVVMTSGNFAVTGKVTGSKLNPPFTLPPESYQTVLCAIQRNVAAVKSVEEEVL
jgi:hypothetical protein